MTMAVTAQGVRGRKRGETSRVLDWMYISQKGINILDPETNCLGEGILGVWGGLSFALR